jgi:hypothetical protein
VENDLAALHGLLQGDWVVWRAGRSLHRQALQRGDVVRRAKGDHLPAGLQAGAQYVVAY